MTVCSKTRLAILRGYAIMDTPPEASFDEITKLSATMSNSSYAAITFVDDHRVWFKSTVGLDLRETSLERSFSAHTISHTMPMIIPDARADSRFADNPLVVSEPYFRFYAGFPLRASDGTSFGTLSVFDCEPRAKGLSRAQTATMSVMARQIEAQLELRRAVHERDAQVEKLNALAKDLRRVGAHDSLTGLPNRAHFSVILAEAMTAAASSGTPLALMLIDVDHFKQVNDSLGHDAGDVLLRQFASKLRQSVRPCDTVARIGGDEFAVLLMGSDDADSFVADALDSLDRRLRIPVKYNTRSITCQASVGTALFPTDANNAEDLIKCGDLALAEAKATRGRAARYQPHMKQEFDRQQTSVTTVRTAFAASELSPFYQPKVSLETGSIVGFEALLRRQSSGEILPFPNPFGPDFPEKRLAAQIGLRMAALILDDMQAWTVAGVPFGHVAMNSCAADFAGNDFAETLLAEMARRGLSPVMLELEVTEGVFLGRGSSHVARALTLLSQAGMRIALDDFGTGYASLSHLRQFPVDVLKIDRSFVAGIGQNADDAAIVRAVINLGRNLGLETVAEGIETNEQAQFVKAQGCDVGQGYLYGAAMTSAELMVIDAQQLPRRAA